MNFSWPWLHRDKHYLVVSDRCKTDFQVTTCAQQVSQLQGLPGNKQPNMVKITTQHLPEVNKFT